MYIHVVLLDKGCNFPLKVEYSYTIVINLMTACYFKG